MCEFVKGGRQVHGKKRTGTVFRQYSRTSKEWERGRRGTRTKGFRGMKSRRRGKSTKQRLSTKKTSLGRCARWKIRGGEEKYGQIKKESWVQKNNEPRERGEKEKNSNRKTARGGEGQMSG